MASLFKTATDVAFLIVEDGKEPSYSAIFVQNLRGFVDNF